MAENYEAMEDAALAALVRENSAEAFAALSGRCAGLLQAVAGRFAGSAAPERDDLLQEGLLGLYIAALSYDGEKTASFRTYAGVCIRNRMADAARRHGSAGNRALNESLPLEAEAASLPAGAGDPAELVEAREQAEALLEKIDSVLSPLEKKALSLYLSGCGREELEARSGMSLKSFDNALFRLRRKLKDLR